MAKNRHGIIKIQHVVPRGARWVVTADGGDTGTTYKSKQEAIDAARESARKDDGVIVIVHGKKGQVIQHPVEATTMDEDAIRAVVRSLPRTHISRGQQIRMGRSPLRDLRIPTRAKSPISSSNKKKAREI